MPLEEKKILLYLLDNEKITRKEAIKILDVQKTKAHEILSSLIAKILQKARKRKKHLLCFKKDEG
ncbi:hypothetical protein [Thermotomaculum hydrothermale]|uniref:hypothetical protein n=1 Tax=Thermotomaculum hydrothermale TaxID=981385 RepID=UPI0019160A38|nr:hypothetical protein [Thermotomaculum hydrothermale]